MLEFLQKYTGTIKVNNEEVSRQEVCSKIASINGTINLLLIPKNTIDCTDTLKDHVTKICVYVKPWMLEKSTPEFLFMETWNKNNPMPLRFMVGSVEQETSRMYFMKLRGEPCQAVLCSKCGRTLINPISKLFGIGPECGTKVGIESRIFINETIANEKLSQIENTIRNITWEGWIPKTAILEMKKYN